MSKKLPYPPLILSGKGPQMLDANPYSLKGLRNIWGTGKFLNNWLFLRERWWNSMKLAQMVGREVGRSWGMGKHDQNTLYEKKILKKKKILRCQKINTMKLVWDATLTHCRVIIIKYDSKS